MNRRREFPESDIVEFRPAAEAVIRPIAEKIAEFGGVALIIDYGDWGIRGNTLQAVRNHKKVDSLRFAGLRRYFGACRFQIIGQIGRRCRSNRDDCARRLSFAPWT